MKIRQSIIDLQAYQGGKPTTELKRELGLERIIKLASNENPMGVSPLVSEAMVASIADSNRYPDGNSYALKNALSNHFGVSPETLTLGNGSNELLCLIAKVFVENKQDEVIFSQYAFPVYSMATKTLSATAVVIPARNFGHDLQAMLEAITDNTKLIFVANPNNPTGTLLSDDELHSFLERVPGEIPVVLDQAYIEYLNKEDVAIDWLNAFSNLIITRTFSKAYGLAGLRVGYAISSSEIADLINRVRDPFNVNSIAQSAAIAALNDSEHLQKAVGLNSAGLKQLERGFEKLGINFIHSFANFVAIEVTNAIDTYKKLLRKGVIVRPVEMPNYLRVSVGTEAENDCLLEALATVL